MGRYLKTVLAAFGLLAAVGAGSAMAAPGSVYGELYLQDGSAIPNRDNLTFVAFVNGTDEIIHTENAYNSPLGLKQGYVPYQGKGYWFVNFANFRTAMDGQNYKVTFTYDNLQARFDGTVPPGYTAVSNPVILQPSVAPEVPANVRAVRNGNDVVVTWDAAAGASYNVYRSKLPSGADNGFSNGIYEKVAANVTSFTDSGVKPSDNAWYLVLAENKNGVFSGHGNEAHAAPAIQMAPGKIHQDRMVLQPKLEKKQVEKTDEHLSANPAE